MHSDINNYYARNGNKFIVLKGNMKKSEISINFKSINVWNKLPAAIRTSDHGIDSVINSSLGEKMHSLIRVEI